MTLQEIFDNWYRPLMVARKRSPESIQSIHATLKLWNETLGGMRVQDIGEMQVLAFIGNRLEMTGQNGNAISVNTVRKDLRNLRTILNHAVERNLIGKLPPIEMPQERLRHARDVFTHREILQLLKATSMFKGEMVGDVDAVEWWRNLITFIYATALRIGTATKVKFDWIDGNVLEIQKEHGIKTKYRLNLSREASKVVGGMRQYLTGTPGERRIFPWPYNGRHLHRCFKRLCIAAGLPKERHFGFHGIRKHTAGELAKTDFAAAVLLLGHSDPKVTARYYLNAEQVCAGAVERLRPLHRVGLLRRVWEWIFRR
jgi:integrase